VLAAGGMLRGSGCLALAAAHARRARPRRRRKRILNSRKMAMFQV
jgi:hypothetical protein